MSEFSFLLVQILISIFFKYRFPTKIDFNKVKGGFVKPFDTKST